jgi:hypothetical protein
MTRSDSRFAGVGTSEGRAKDTPFASIRARERRAVAGRGAAAAADTPDTADAVRALQRAIGNRAVGRLLAAAPASRAAGTLVRSPTLVTRVEAPADAQAWKSATALLAAQPTPAPATDADPVTRADGTVFDPPTDATSDAGWVRALLRFLHLTPAAGPGPDACTLDGEPSTAADVALRVAETGLFAGSHPIDPDAARPLVDEYLAEQRTARGIAGEVEAKLAQNDLAAIVGQLRDMPMARMLAVLEVIRADGKLDELIERLTPVPPRPRITAAMLAAGGHLGLRFAAAADDLVGPDLRLIREFLFGQVIDNDVRPPVPMTKAHQGDPDTGRPFERPSGADPGWAATADDAAWVDGFLRYFRLMRVPFDDQSMWFNETVRPLAEIVDLAVEQGLLAGRSLDAEAVKQLIVTRAPTFSTRAPLEASQLVLQYTVVPTTEHRDLATGARSKDKTAQQIAAQYTVKFKNAGAWWSEIDVSGLVQATFFADPATGKPKLDPSSLELQNLVAGVQGAWVVPLFTKKVQLQAVIQGVIGAARDYEAPGNGTIVVRPVGSGGPAMGQVAGQLQVVVQPFDGLGLQFFIGTQGSISKVGPVTTLDGTPVLLGIQWAFDL